MASIFGTGKPSGALGGASMAEQERLDKTEQSQRINIKQAEFYDWLDAAEQRAVERERKITTDKATIEEQPSKTEASIAKSELEETQADADKEFTPMAQEQRIRQYKRAMNRQSIDDIGGVYAAMSEQLSAPGANKKQVYDQARQALIQLSGAEDVTQANALLEDLGISQDYSDEALSAMEMFGSVGLHDIGTTRQEHLTAAEYGFKIREALAGSKANDLSKGELKQVTVTQMGDILSSEEWFKDLEGDKDDNGMWTEDKGSAATSMASVAHGTKSLYQDIGVPIGPIEAGGVMMEMMNTMPELFITNEFGGEGFNPVPFQSVSQTVLGEVADRLATSPAGLSFNDVWAGSKREILSTVKNTYQQRALERSKTIQAARDNPLGRNNFVEKRGMGDLNDRTDKYDNFNMDFPGRN